MRIKKYLILHTLANNTSLGFPENMKNHDNQAFIKIALNIFTVQDKVNAVIFDKFKSKPRDIRVVESSYGFSIYFQQIFFFQERIINSKSRNGSKQGALK